MFTVSATLTYGICPAPTRVDERLELGEVDVALERVLGLGIVGLVDDDVDERAALQLLVQRGWW